MTINLFRSLRCVALTSLAGFAAVGANAQSLLFDFGQTTVASPYVTLSPGHSLGTVAITDVSWNKIAVSTPNSSLVFGDGTAATGITLTLGQEATAGNNTINYSTAIGNLNLAGTGGAVPGQQNLLTFNSIYGNDTSSTAVGRDGFFGGGTAAAGDAIGLRLDGLTAGNYTLYVMGRNVNSDAASLPMNIYGMTGPSGGTFGFSALIANPQSNIGYPSVSYFGQYTNFVAGENYVALSLTVASGDSIFLAVDGGSATDTRGFLNSLELIPTPIPEPAFASILALAGFTWLRIRGKTAKD